MRPTVAARLLAVASAVAVAAPCATDADCSLLGVCASSGACVCDPGWRGAACETLDVGAPDGARGRIRVANGSSSWGGSVIRGDDGAYHLFFARFEKGCGLNSWVNNSVCVHAVSENFLGPFVDADVAVGTWCHGPKITRAADGTYLLFHLRQAADPAARVCDCAAHGGSEAACSWPGFPGLVAPPDGRGDITFAHSRSLDGPWVQWGRDVLTPRGSGWEAWVSNPSPFARADGSVLLAYRAWGTTPEAPSRSERIGLAAAPAWDAPYERVTDDFIATGEDPFVFVDARGNGHLLNHTVWTPRGLACGYAHHFAHASNLSRWTPTGVAVPCALTWANGTAATPSRRERPELLLEPGTLRPLAFYNGVAMYAPQVTDESFTLAIPVL